MSYRTVYFLLKNTNIKQMQNIPCGRLPHNLQSSAKQASLISTLCFLSQIDSGDSFNIFKHSWYLFFNLSKDMSNRGVCLGVALDIKYFFQLFKVLFNDLPSELIRIPWAIKKAMKVDTALRIILTDWGFNFRNFRFRIFGCSRWMQLVKIFSNVYTGLHWLKKIL